MSSAWAVGIVLIVSCLVGRGAREQRYLAVTDPEAYGERSGYAIKPPKITASNFFTTSGGLDCGRYNGASTLKEVATEKGRVHGEAIRGYLCLPPPVRDNFGVIMESRDVAAVGTDTSNKDEQTRGFFRSLRFNAISSTVSRSHKTASYQIGKGPFQMAAYQEKLCVVL